MANWDAKKLFDAIVTFENNVGKLYDQISDDVKAQFGKFFENMAQDEYRHAKIYTALGKKAAEANIALTDQAEAEYLNSLIENSILKDSTTVLDKVKTIKNKWQVLDLAERVEREALQYIYELTRLFPDFAADEVAVLLKEEKKHLQMVLDRKRGSEAGFLGL